MFSLFYFYRKRPDTLQLHIATPLSALKGKDEELLMKFQREQSAPSCITFRFCIYQIVCKQRRIILKYINNIG